MSDVSEQGEVVLDLLGDPVLPLRDPRGRPSFSKTPENQKLVITLRGAGWSQADIAARLQCDEKTLRKHFSRELENGAVMLESLALQVLVKRMLDGSVSAAQKVLDVARAQRAPKASPVLGKKAQQKNAAHQPPADLADLVRRTHDLQTIQ